MVGSDLRPLPSGARASIRVGIKSFDHTVYDGKVFWEIGSRRDDDILLLVVDSLII